MRLIPSPDLSCKHILLSIIIISNNNNNNILTPPCQFSLFYDSVTSPVSVVVKVRDYIVHLLDRGVDNLRTCLCAWRVGAVRWGQWGVGAVWAVGHILVPIGTNILYWRALSFLFFLSLFSCAQTLTPVV